VCSIRKCPANKGFPLVHGTFLRNALRRICASIYKIANFSSELCHDYVLYFCILNNIEKPGYSSGKKCPTNNGFDLFMGHL
jgi:hypothetical protein